jgi:hypothetical protein
MTERNPACIPFGFCLANVRKIKVVIRGTSSLESPGSWALLARLSGHADSYRLDFR